MIATMSVLAARLLQIRGKRDDYFRIALLISVVIHAGMLAINFSREATPLTQEPTLEVILLNVEGDTEPLDPQVLAQHDFDGGGAAEQGVASTPLPLTTPEASNELALAALRKRQKELEAEQERLFALLQAQDAAAADNETPVPGDAAEAGKDTLQQESLVINAQIAALKDKIDRYNAKPRQYFTGPSAASSEEAQYLDTWRQKIELLGTEHYPPEARGKIYGSLQLTVYIKKDGSLQHVDIERPSVHPVLNQAALRIVQLAAPFPPLPAELAAEIDVLAITRTWHFTREQLETAIP